MNDDEYLAKRLWDTIREDIAAEEGHRVFVHDWRPYYGNPWLTITEYDSNRRQEFCDFPGEYQHPFAACIEYDESAAVLGRDWETAQEIAELNGMIV